MVVYESIKQYIECSTNLVDRINRIDQIIEAIENSMLSRAETGGGANNSTINVEEYSLDDGQTKIRTKYRSSEDFAAMGGMLAQLDFLKQRLIARLNNNITGRVIRLVDGKNFIGRCRR